MNPNKTQKKIIWFAIIIMAIMMLFPPWVRVYDRGLSSFAGYSIIFTLRNISSSGDVALFNLDFKRLLIQFFCVITIAGSLLYIYK